MISYCSVSKSILMSSLNLKNRVFGLLGVPEENVPNYTDAVRLVTGFGHSFYDQEDGAGSRFMQPTFVGSGDDKSEIPSGLRHFSQFATIVTTSTALGFTAYEIAQSAGIL